MFSFEGEYRRKPVQSLGGVSKHQQRESLLQKAQIERTKRQVYIKLQSLYDYELIEFSLYRSSESRTRVL